MGSEWSLAAFENATALCCPQCTLNTLIQRHEPNREIKMSVLEAGMQTWGEKLIGKKRKNPFLLLEISVSLFHPFM